MKKIAIRRADENDFHYIYDLICQLVDAEYGTISQQSLREIYVNNLNSDEKEIYVAEENDVVVGFISVTYDMRLSEVGKVAVIDELVVDAKQRSNGIGSQLLDFAINCAKSNSCYYIEVETSQKRIDTHRFYEKSGFVKNGFRFGYSCD